jgi:hypothetical protein
MNINSLDYPIEIGGLYKALHPHQINWYNEKYFVLHGNQHPEVNDIVMFVGSNSTPDIDRALGGARARPYQFLWKHKILYVFSGRVFNVLVPLGNQLCQ